jgi:RNase P/RNase MRP subunit POP5
MRFHHHCFERARLRGDARVMEVRLESLCLEVGRTARRMFSHVGLRFEPRYLAFRDVRYPNAKSGSIATGIAFEHLDALGEARVRWLRERLIEFENWFHEPG